MDYDHAAFARFRWAACLGLCGAALLLGSGLQGFDLLPFVYFTGLYAGGLMFVWYVCRSAIWGLAQWLPASGRLRVLFSHFGIALMAETVCLLVTLVVLSALNFASGGPGFSMTIGSEPIVERGQLTEAGLRFAIGRLMGQGLVVALIACASTLALLVLARESDGPRKG